MKAGFVGRLGGWSARRARLVIAAWVVGVIALGALAPQVEHALSGAGWEASGSESVVVRDTVNEEFGGLSGAALNVVVQAQEGTPRAEIDATVARVETTLAEHESVAQVLTPRDGAPQTPDGLTQVVIGGAGANTTEMVHAADELEDELRAAGTESVSVYLTGASGMWADFNAANREAMVRSELISWPVTLAILIVAFGALVAAGLPLLLTILGLAASAGSLVLVSQLFDVSIWAMNFALMFALALGIDYALFIVVRFRSALAEDPDRMRAVVRTMDTAGTAVLFSGITVLISLSAVMLVPSPAFRSMALGIMLAVSFVLLAALTLLPAVLGRLGPNIDKGKLPWLAKGDQRSERFARHADRMWRRPGVYGIAALALLLVLAAPVLGLRTAMPSITVVPEEDGARQGYVAIQEAFGPGAPGALQLVGPAPELQAALDDVAADPGIAAVGQVQRSAEGTGLAEAIPTVDPSDPALADTVDRLRADLPPSVLVGGAAVENLDLQGVLETRAPLAIGTILVLGFALLLFAFQAPLIAAIGVLTNLLATGAAFGVAKLIFQDGHLSGLLNFESQGFVDAWGPIFFFAMIFAISMDYTVFLLSAAKEEWDRSHDARAATVEGLARSGRVVLAAAAVMVAVFFTFALSGPLPPKEMGIILGTAVLLDALLVRLLLLPVALRLAGPLAWAQPRWLGRILPEVRFGH
jgi:RND superfamily putative drug exporter